MKEFWDVWEYTFTNIFLPILKNILIKFIEQVPRYIPTEPCNGQNDFFTRGKIQGKPKTEKQECMPGFPASRQLIPEKY